MAENKQVSFNIRKVPRSLHTKFKAKCAHEGKPMQEVVIELLKAYVNKVPA